MKIFIDTSSIVKLYHKEVNTARIEAIFSRNTIVEVFLSEITKIEFTSAVWKKARVKEIAEAEAGTIVDLFEKDCMKFSFIPVDSSIVEQAKVLISRYWSKGLRTLDSIQLATAISLSGSVQSAICSDEVLKTILITEGLPCDG